MGTFDNKKLKNIETKRFAFGIITLLTLLISIFAIIVMISEAGFIASSLMIAFIVALNIYVILKYYPYFKNKMEFRDIDRNIFRLLYAFLEYLDYKDKEAKLQKLFSAHFKNDISRLYTKCSVDDINYISICKDLSKEKIDVRYFAIYTLLDIASADKLYSIQEEEFIENARIYLRIHKISFNSIKSSYLKQGLKEERKILEEEARHKTAKEITKSFLPYNAYKVLGVSPSVTKKQLKKAYRTLAKKYHPDKFNGQDNEIIEKMEIKFQEITEAYEIIKSFKKY